MTTWFVSRHPGALEWIRQEEVAFDIHVPHLDISHITAGDVVIGTLPIHLAAEVHARGASYVHLELHVPSHMRGPEISAEQLRVLGGALRPYRVEKL